MKTGELLFFNRRMVLYRVETARVEQIERLQVTPGTPCVLLEPHTNIEGREGMWVLVKGKRYFMRHKSIHSWLRSYETHTEDPFDAIKNSDR